MLTDIGQHSCRQKNRLNLSAAFAALAALILGGCAGLLPTANQQTVAGISDVEIAFKESCVVPTSNGAGSMNDTLAACLSHVRWRDGKESEIMDVAIDLAHGTFNYRRDNTRAFEGQAVRAAVERAIADEVGEVAPGAVDAITKAVLKALIP